MYGYGGVGVLNENIMALSLVFIWYTFGIGHMKHQKGRVFALDFYGLWQSQGKAPLVLLQKEDKSAVLWTVVLVFIWTAGGLLVALTIKYTNVIIKGFASALSLILICVNGWWLLGDYLDMIFICGAFVTVIATFNYNDSVAQTSIDNDSSSDQTATFSMTVGQTTTKVKH
eukprot:919319_1